MIDIENKEYMPSAEEMCVLAQNSSFDALCCYMKTEYQAKNIIEYSGDKVLLGWNLKFKKAGRTLCTVYPRSGRFFMLIVVGRKEKKRVEALLPQLCPELQNIYNNTKEGMGQRWLLLNIGLPSELYNDALKLIRIRRESK